MARVQLTLLETLVCGAIEASAPIALSVSRCHLRCASRARTVMAMRITSLAACAIVLLASRSARADEGKWQAQPTLFAVGLALAAGGYAPSAIAAVPSGVGLVGRGFGLFFTLGIPCWLPGVDPNPDNTDEENRRSLRSKTPDYLCRGDHGAIQLFVPMAGPFLFVANHPHDTILNKGGNELSTGAKVALYASGISQIVGVTSLLASAAFGGRAPRRSASTAGARLELQPWLVPGGIGVSGAVLDW